MQLELLQAVIPKKAQVFMVSSYAKRGLDSLLFALQKVVAKDHAKTAKKAKEKAEALPVIRLKYTPEAWQIVKTDKTRYYEKSGHYAPT